MKNKDDQAALAQAVEEFALEYATPEEAKTASVKLDALVTTLLTTSFAERRLGKESLERISDGSLPAPDVLQEIGGERFSQAARSAEALLEITQVSVLDLGDSTSDDLLNEANANRDTLYRMLKDLLGSIILS